MEKATVKQKSFDFALRIIQHYSILKRNHEYIISKQLLRSGTSVGAMIRESEFAESKADFIHKLSIALKEANETLYWIDLLLASNLSETKSLEILKKTNQDILHMLIAIISTAKKNLKK